MATFQTLPTELVLRICHTLDTADVVRLSEASRFLNQLCRSSDVWKSRTRELWALYGLGGDDLDSNSELLDWTGWRDLLGPYRKYLGLWASHLPFRGRLISVNLMKDRIVVSHVTCVNTAHQEDRLNDDDDDDGDGDEDGDGVPHGAALYDALDRSYLLGQHHPSPERGLSVDVFKPQVVLRPMFTIAPRAKPTLFRSSNNSNSNTTLTLSLADTSTAISCDLARHGQSLQEALEEESLAGRFPTIEMIGNDMLRGATLNTTSASDQGPPSVFIQSPAFRWTVDQQAADVHSQEQQQQQQQQQHESSISSRATTPWLQAQAPTLQEAAERFVQHRLFSARHLRRPPGGSPATFSPRPSVLSDEAEHFFPLSHWSNAKPFVSTPSSSSSSSSSPGACPLDHLRGLWVGTFGPHGTEFGWVHAKPAASDNDGHGWVLEYVKVTGDVNVPSGVVSWATWLPEPTAPTVQAEDLARWNKSTLAAMREVGEARWEAGTVEAYGQVAFSGFVQPRQSMAKITFVRDKDVVNQLRFRWCELGKVSIFKRVQPSQVMFPPGFEPT